MGPPSIRNIFAIHLAGFKQISLQNGLNFFITCVKPTKENPSLLILDGHYTHTRNLDLIQKAIDCYVTILSIPPHTSHRMQPLDVSFMGPLKANYASEINTFIHEKNCPVEMKDIVGIFGTAFQQTARYSLAENGFRGTRIYPTNQHVFNENEFYKVNENDVDLKVANVVNEKDILASTLSSTSLIMPENMYVK